MFGASAVGCYGVSKADCSRGRHRKETPHRLYGCEGLAALQQSLEELYQEAEGQVLVETVGGRDRAG